MPLPEVDLTNLKQFRVAVTVARDAAQDTIVCACQASAQDLGLAMGAELDWFLISDPDNEEDTYELRIIPLNIDQLTVLMERCVSRGIELAAEALEDRADGLIDLSDAIRIIRETL